MHALTLKPWWAALVALGDKTIEHRSWTTKIRQDLLICAGAGKFKEMICGHTLAVVDIAEIIPYDDSHADRIFCGADVDLPAGGYSWILENVRPIVPVPVKGQQRLFTVDIELSYLDHRGDDLYEYWIDQGFIKRFSA